MKVICYLAKDVDLYFMGRTLAGLYEQPGISLTIRLVDWWKTPISAGVEVNGVKLGIQLSDHRDVWDEALLAWCDLYAKRSLSPSEPGSAPHKVVPYGLHCAGYSARAAAGLLTALATTVPGSLPKRWRAVYRYLQSPHWQAFEYRPSDPVSETILYQTRLWSPEEAPGDEQVNQQRIDLLLDLKREFKDRFVGGIVPNAYALKRCPELVTTENTRQREYVQWAKRPAVGIYTRGLFGSLAFKMAEYTASSKCIVSEPVENLTPQSMDYLSIYRTNAECVAHCQSLLSNPKLRQEYREETWRYYCDQVRPSALIEKLLAQVAARG